MSRQLTASAVATLVVRKYPDMLGTVTHQLSTVPLGDAGDAGGFTEGLLATGGVGPITRSLSSVDGDYSVPTLSLKVNDDRGILRALLADPTSNLVDQGRWELRVEIVSEAQRNADGDRTSLFAGIVTEAQPEPGRMFSMTAKDILGGHLKGFDLDAPLPVGTLGEHFGTSPEFPEGNRSQVLPLPYGECSDHGTEDIAGNTAEKGYCRAFYTGKELISPGFPGTPPTAPTYLGQVTNLQVTMHGSGNTKRVAVGVALTTRFGETPPTVLVVEDYPDPPSPSHYAVWTWDLPVANADEIVHAVEYVGEGLTYPKFFLDGDGGTGPPATTYTDDADDQHFKLYRHGPLSVNTAQVAPGDPGVQGSGPMFWDRWLVARGVLPFDTVDFFGSSVADAAGGTTKRVLLNASTPNAGIRNTWLIAPGDSLWPHADPWTLSELGARVTVFYTRGAISTEAINGNVGFAVNIGGYTEQPDASGLMLDQAGPILQHLLTNWGGLDPDNPVYVDDDTWNDLPRFANGNSKLQTSLFAQYQTDSATAMATDAGAKFRFVIDTPMTLRDILRHASISGYLVWRTNHFGQIGPKRIPHGLSASGRPFRFRIEAQQWLQPTFDRNVTDSVSYVFDYDAEAQKYRREPITIKDDDLIAANGGKSKPPLMLEMRFAGDPLTARVSAFYWLELRKRPRRFQPTETSLRALVEDLGDPWQLTHYDGLGENGETDTQMIVYGHAVDEQRRVVTFTGLDVSQLAVPSIPGLSPLQDEDVMDGNLGDEDSNAPPPAGAFHLDDEAA